MPIVVRTIPGVKALSEEIVNEVRVWEPDDHPLRRAMGGER
jgi:hypothetical protein